MTDREMLELAAKAAGWEFVFCEFGGVIDGFHDGPDTVFWNPLTSSADALEPAVKLRMGISIPMHENIRADVICFGDTGVNIREIGGDPIAATRRAITRAAAAIQEAKEGV